MGGATPPQDALKVLDQVERNFLRLYRGGGAIAVLTEMGSTMGLRDLRAIEKRFEQIRAKVEAEAQRLGVTMEPMEPKVAASGTVVTRSDAAASKPKLRVVHGDKTAPERVIADLRSRLAERDRIGAQQAAELNGTRAELRDLRAEHRELQVRVATAEREKRALEASSEGEGANLAARMLADELERQEELASARGETITRLEAELAQTLPPAAAEQLQADRDSMATQVANLRDELKRERVAAAERRMPAADGRVTELEEQLGERDGRIRQLQTQLAEAQGDRGAEDREAIGGGFAAIRDAAWPDGPPMELPEEQVEALAEMVRPKPGPKARRTRVEDNLYQSPAGVYEVGFRDSTGMQRWCTAGTNLEGARTLREQLLAARDRKVVARERERLEMLQAAVKPALEALWPGGGNTSDLEAALTLVPARVEEIRAEGGGVQGVVEVDANRAARITELEGEVAERDEEIAELTDRLAEGRVDAPGVTVDFEPAVMPPDWTWRDYMGMLFEMARAPDAPGHVFDRLERALRPTATDGSLPGATNQEV